MIAVVVPTIRPKKMEEFKKNWLTIFKQYEVFFIIVHDGEIPVANGKTAKEIMEKYSDLIYNRQDSVRNLGFAYIARYLPDVDYIITLDDDVEPLGDTIGLHLRVLNSKAPISWLSTSQNAYMRGFPYSIRTESEIVVSHGVWEGDKDWDAPTQLVMGNPKVDWFVGPVPKGVYFPMSIMNVAFKRKMLPFMYQVPMTDNYQRFSDIWTGILVKKECDKRNWAIVTGYSKVLHRRASNVFKNLQNEAKGIERNETYWLDGECEQTERWKTYCYECGIHIGQ